MAARQLLDTMKQICLCAAASFASQDWSKNDEKLLQAVDYNDAERVTTLLVRKGLIPTKLDSEGKSAFHLAATRGNVDCLEVMLAHGVDAMTKDSSGYNALHLSAKHGHPQCVSKLLQASCPVDVTDSCGRTALHHAAVSGCISCSEILCDFKASLNIRDKDGSTPLLLAAKMSHSELCRYLLHRGASVNSRDQQGRTALMLACEHGSVETVEVLIHAGARVTTVDAMGHDAIHYSTATGNALIQHYLQDAAQCRSWASEESSMDQVSQTSSTSQPLSKDKNSTPRKRKAPPPPQSALNQEDRDAYEEIVRLRQERAQFLQKIRSLEQQQEKQKQKWERQEMEDGSLRSMEKQVKDLQKQLAEREGEKTHLGKEVEALRSRLSSLENEKENTSYDIDTLQDEEGDLLEFPGAEVLLSKKTMSLSTEELLATLQGQVQTLTLQNKELQEKIQILENYERDESDLDPSGDFIPVLLYDSLQAEFERLKGQHADAQAMLQTLEGGKTSGAAGQPDTGATLEQLKAKYEAKIRTLEEALRKAGKGQAGAEEEGGTGRERGDGDEGLRAAAGSALAKELAQTQEKYEAALAEVQRLREQIQLGILSVEDQEGAEAADSSRSELETVRVALHKAQEDLRAKERRVKDLEEHLESRAGAASPTRSMGETEANLSQSLEEAAKEKAALLERCRRAEAAVEELRRNVEEKSRDFQRAVGPADGRRLEEENQELQQQLGELMRQHGEVKAQLGQLREALARKDQELGALKEQLAAKPISLQEHEDVVDRLSTSLAHANHQLQELRVEHSTSQRALVQLQRDADGARRDSVPRGEHIRTTAALEGSLQEIMGRAQQLERELAAKGKETAQLRGELASAREGTVTRAEHERVRSGLQAEVTALSQKLSELGRKHEKTCAEVFQVQREALFMKSEKHAAEAQLAAVEKQLQSLRAESQRVQELHRHIEDSARLVKDKDRKITELSKEVFKLKEALNGLSELPTKAGALPKAQQGQLEAGVLQGRIKALEEQLTDMERHHSKVVSLYRGHLLYAVQELAPQAGGPAEGPPAGWMGTGMAPLGRRSLTWNAGAPESWPHGRRCAEAPGPDPEDAATSGAGQMSTVGSAIPARLLDPGQGHPKPDNGGFTHGTSRTLA
ncbi:ankyrin repeat domain-containing protein 24 isoform X3 [Alligator mississippiensis]|uniref:ankyrin repeat domain-containing protein 24 isoform X3 n=1 Tax=Alligator mississippiensis TaxID=8496 RepID=UPI0028773754|nr:ankyrin repeat domain-containing protein 24 isoform X3 [Alligator mississippiensis]